MKSFAVVVGIVLIAHCSILVTGQDDSSEEDNFEEILKQYRVCSRGYCVPSNQCLNGFINTDGESIVDIRIQDDDDMIELDPERQEDTCEFMTTCCAFKAGFRREPGGSAQITTEEPIAQPQPSCGANHPNGYVYRLNSELIAQFGEFPWMAALMTRTTSVMDKDSHRYICGGSLIHPQVVLTAAHCVHDQLNALDTLVVRLGEWDMVTENEPIIHQQYGVRNIIIHEKYVDKKYHNDLALLIMEDTAELNVNVNTICLPSQYDNFDGQRCLISGWGIENFNRTGKYSEVLKRVELPVVSRNRCKQMLKATKLGPFFQLHKSFMCAGGEAGVDACKGDGGSPLVCKRDNQYTQAGIVAWGIGCGERDVPAAYVKVSDFTDWIQDKLADEGIHLNDP